MAKNACSVTNQHQNNNDDFQTVSTNSTALNKKSSSKRGRVYVGNLPLQWSVEELRALVVERINDSRSSGDVDSSGVEIQVEKESNDGVPQHAFVVAAGMDPEQIVTKMRGAKLNGCKLTVQRAARQKQQHRSNGRNKKQYPSSSANPCSFASSSWSKPKPQHQSDQGRKSRQSSINGAETHAAVPERVADNEDEGARREEYPNMSGSLECSNNGPGSFGVLMSQKPLSSLLEEFGAQDPEWQKVKVVEEQPLATHQSEQNIRASAVAAAPADAPNRLERQGKAPIHVEFSSFGYRHGIPSELRAASTGNSHSRPLPAIDSRCLAEIPHYLAWMDGSSGAVRNAMLRGTNDDTTEHDGSTGSTDVRDFVHDSVVQPVVDALVAAIDEGGYGFAMPLNMTVFVGSEQGRHRSVVTAELAATSLRQALRQNDSNHIKATVSVSTCHRDIEQQQQNQRSKNENAMPKNGKKQREFEDSW